jgi:flagellar M-ring protein FliF
LNFEELKAKFRKFLKENATPRNIALTLGALTLLSFLGFILITHSPEKDYAVLYTHLNPDDAGEILSVLQESHIPYKVEGDGSIILVPKDKVYEVRLKLAAKGIPHGKTVGFEIFDEPKLGITQFQENVNYLRALEGELERTIESIDAIEEAKVNIALPKDSIFVRETQEPKASILIKLWPGRDLTPEQVKAIVFLVSHAVPGLKPENVEVVDNRGRVLTDLLDINNENQVLSSKELQIKRRLERDIEKKVRAMLSRVLGSGKVVVSASVEIETGSVKRKEEIYNPDMVAVVSQRKIKEKEKGQKKEPQGIPGSTTNVPPVVNTGSPSQTTEREKQDVTTNYDVSKTVQESILPIFKIKRITVGVLIDGKYKKIVNKDGSIEYKFVQRPPDEMKIYESIVKSAIGYDPKRGDQVTVASVPFESKLLSQQGAEVGRKWNVWYFVAAGFILLITAGFMIIIFRKRKVPPPQKPMELPGAETLLAELETKKKEGEFEEINLQQNPKYLKLVEIGKDHPELLANVIGKWLKEEGTK